MQLVGSAAGRNLQLVSTSQIADQNEKSKRHLQNYNPTNIRRRLQSDPLISQEPLYLSTVGTKPSAGKRREAPEESISTTKLPHIQPTGSRSSGQHLGIIHDSRQAITVH